MVRLTLSRPLSLVKTPTLDNLNELSENVSSPNKTKKKNLKKQPLSPVNKNVCKNIHSPPVSRIVSPIENLSKKIPSFKQSYLPNIFVLPDNISQTIMNWIRGNHQKINVKEREANKSVEWGYFVDLESVTKEHYLKTKFNRKIPIYDTLPIFMVIQNPWTLTPIKEKNSKLTFSQDSTSNYSSQSEFDCLRSCYENGLLYAIISWSSVNRKQTSVGIKFMLFAFGFMTFTFGVYSLYALKNLNYGLHKHGAE